MTDPTVSPTLYPPDQPLGEVELAKLLRCSVKTLRRRGIRHTKVGRSPIYLWRWVLEFLERSAA